MKRNRLNIDIRKEALTQSAMQIFYKVGLAKTSLRLIAKEAKVSPALILYHFESLDELFIQVVKKIVQEGRSISEDYLKGVSHPKDQLIAYVEAMFDWIALKQPYLSIMMQFYHLAIFNEDFNQLNLNIVKGGRTRIQSILDLGVASRVFKISDVSMTTKSIQDLLTGTFFRMAATKGLYNPSLERQELIKAVLILVQGNVS